MFFQVTTALSLYEQGAGALAPFRQSGTGSLSPFERCTGILLQMEKSIVRGMLLNPKKKN